MIGKYLQLAAGASLASTADNAEAIDFDGTNDYLSRASDLTGNADGKTFTFSAWVYVSSYSTATQRIYASVTTGGNMRFSIVVNSSGITLTGVNASATTILSSVGNTVVPLNSFTNIIVSVDLSNTENRFVYINDALDTTQNWATYSDDSIDFTASSISPAHVVAVSSLNTTKVLGRLAHLYLDYTYRDLSVEANRRLFITADRKPASGQAALNPILYLPLSDATQPGKNLGTGGDFTLTGVVAKSGRGPNQFNAAYSDFDGSADYLSRTSIAGIADGKQIIFSCVFSTDALSSQLFAIGESGGNPLIIGFGGVPNLTIQIYNTAKSVLALNATISGVTLVANRNYQLVFSVDMSNTANRSVYINGQSATTSWSAYIDTNLHLTYSGSGGGYYVGLLSAFFNGRLGHLYFDTSYIDLSVPANLAKFVTGTGIDAKPVDLGANGELPTGTAPLIYLPMFGNNAGKNYGTGGDFTVNSGPYPGARGPNEYWGNKADFDGSTGYLSRASALTGVSDGKTFSASFRCIPDANNGIFFKLNIDTTKYLLFKITSSGEIQCKLLIDGSVLLYFTGTFQVLLNSTHHSVNICIDLENASKRFFYINNIQESVTWNSYVNSNIRFSSVTSASIGVDWNGVSTYQTHLDGKLSELYFTTDYIDFSLEANRLKFRDAFGNPVDLRPQIEAGTLPNPAIYMRFDPANKGKNDGTGGDFTVNGTITDGGQL